MVWGRSRGLCGRSGAEKREEHGYLENVFISRAGARSASSGAILGRSWGLCWRSWAALGAYVGGLGPLLGPILAVLGRSWALCWRSWAALGAYLRDLGASVGGLGPLLGSMLAVLGLCWRSWGALGRKVAQTRAGTGVPKGQTTEACRGPPEAPRRFFSAYPFFL